MNKHFNIVDKIRLFLGLVFLLLSLMFLWSDNFFVFLYKKIRKIPPKTEIKKHFNDTMGLVKDWYKEA